ncbi:MULTISPECIES: DUF4276 family protein [unclassified Rhizobium]|uniref:DUF4276 family protein n=1 Tax=unclassified Rhizobium TaxID=2613769 RepID=UPI0009E943F8|nr:MULTISPECIES: DUF4276 family protein [unclassified Rhizobium]
MTRLLVHVEGQTEETFVNEVLGPHLYTLGFHKVSARLLGAARVRKRRGGICAWEVVADEVARHLLNDGGAFATTIVDYYALPSGEDGWPGRHACAGLPYDQRSSFLVQNLRQDFAARYPGLAGRFIPFVAMHEFEGLLFSNPQTMAQSMGQPELADHFSAIRAAFETPEHINDSYITAPSKRLIAALPGYQKVLHGNVAFIDIGLDNIRQECPIFDEWLTEIEKLAT